MRGWPRPDEVRSLPFQLWEGPYCPGHAQAPNREYHCCISTRTLCLQMYGLSTLLSRTKGVCLRPTSRLSNVGELQESPHSIRKTCPHAEPNTFDRCDLELPTLKVLVKTIVRKGSLNEIKATHPDVWQCIEATPFLQNFVRVVLVHSLVICHHTWSIGW